MPGDVTRRRLTKIVAWWAAGALLLLVGTDLAGFQYDSRGVAGLLWWLAQIAALPVWFVDETLRSQGVRDSAYGG